MNQYSKSKPIDPTDFYQKQKLYVENVIIEESLELYEREFKAFLSKYGTIIDIKILKNRNLNRPTKVLRVRDL